MSGLVWLYLWALVAVPLWVVARCSLDRERNGGRERFTRAHDSRRRTW